MSTLLIDLIAFDQTDLLEQSHCYTTDGQVALTEVQKKRS